MSCTDGGSAKPVLPHQICSPTNLQLCSNSSATHPTLGACIGNPGIGYASASAQGNLLSRVLCPPGEDRKSTRLNSSHGYISYAVFCLKKKNIAISHERCVTHVCPR